MKQKFIRQAINFLLITLVINVGGWAFNKDALADTLFSEMNSISEESNAHTSSPDAPKSIHTHTCNHWCHTEANFPGMTSQLTFFMPKLPEGFSTLHFANIQRTSPDTLFRPPIASLT